MSTLNMAVCGTVGRKNCTHHFVVNVLPDFLGVDARSIPCSKKHLEQLYNPTPRIYSDGYGI